jgi:hypothetical protein
MEIFFHIIFKLKENRPYLRLCRIFCMVMVTIGAIGCTGEWIKALDPESSACTMTKFTCYQGPPLTLPEFVFLRGASLWMFLLPVLYLLSAFLLLFKPPKTYSILLIMNIAMFVTPLLSEPQPYMHTLTGVGQWLHMTAVIFLFILSIPMAINELADPDFLEDFREAERLRPVKSEYE